LAGPYPHRRTLLLVLLGLAGILNYADRQIIAVLKPLLQQDLHWSDLDYGRMTSIFQFASAVAFLGAGQLVDRVGWRRANPLAVGSWSLAAMGHAFAHTLGQFTGVRIALGATEALGTPTVIKTAAVLFEAKDRSLAMGVMNMTNNLGAVLTPLIIPGLALAVGWRPSFFILGVLGLIWSAGWWLLVKNNEPEEARGPARKIDLLAAARTKTTWGITGAKVMSDQVWWFLLFWTPDLLHHVFHLGLKEIGLPLAVIYSGAGVGSVAGGYASTRMVRAGMAVGRARKLALLACAVLAMPVSLLLLTDNVWIAVGLLGLTLGAHQGYSANLFALFADVTPHERVASATSIGSLFGNLGGMAVLQTAGWLLANGYGYAPLLALASVSYLIGLAWLQLLVPKVELCG
jgi:ACS family hexuronate transporter-like MFS transporter